MGIPICRSSASAKGLKEPGFYRDSSLGTELLTTETTDTSTVPVGWWYSPVPLVPVNGFRVYGTGFHTDTADFAFVFVDDRA